MARMILIASLLLAVSAAHAAELSGPAIVVDGDTLRLGSVRVRLFGIDAPEMRQKCRRDDGAAWNCGRAATTHMGDPIDARPGFVEMLEYMAANGARVILVENASRFARDLAVQLAGHDYLKRLGFDLIPADAPDFFIEETPTAVMVRQVLGAVSQFEKAALVAKLKAARDRKRATTGRCEVRPPLSAAD